MALFNTGSVELDEALHPRSDEDVARARDALERSGPHEPLLVDNRLVVVGNAEMLYAARELGHRAVYGQRLTPYHPEPTFPDRFSIEISNLCNYDCVMCPRTVMRREQRHMDPALFEKVIAEIHRHEVGMVDLYRLGESALHPRFVELLGMLGRFGQPVTSSLFSNGGALTEKKLRAILDSPIAIFAISMNATDAATYRAITGGRGDFDKVVDLVGRVKALKRKRLPSFGVQFLEQEATADQLDRFVELFIDHVDFIETSMLEDFGGQLEQNRAYIASSSYDLGAVTDERPPCQRSVWGRCRIYSNGDVVPCICDINAEHLLMGNVHEQTIEEIFQGERWQTFRRMHQKGQAGDHPLCGPCTDWLIYTEHNRRHKVVLDHPGAKRRSARA